MDPKKSYLRVTQNAKGTDDNNKSTDNICSSTETTPTNIKRRRCVMKIAN